ncbi:MAG: SRPBCC domain-containing protein [Chitinophagaceae bacterium]|nr:MAG: SRPBCC domain-containing protein [Chitinophagaceae bacterium]
MGEQLSGTERTRDNFVTAVNIKSDAATVWNTLTDPGIMREWMGEPEMNIVINTDWKIHSTILISGFHHVQFVSKGYVLHYEKEKKLVYTHLSSVSRLPDVPASYTVLEFILKPSDNHIQLTISIDNFPTDTIRKHLEFFWRTAIVLIKKVAEKQSEI